MSKFVHIRTTFSIPNHKGVVENEMANFLYRKYPKISIDSVKTIYSTILELMTKKQQYELLPENASFEEVRRYKGITKKDFSRIIETAMSISIPPRKISFRRHQSLPFVKKYIYTEITKLGLMTRYCVDFKIQ